MAEIRLMFMDSDGFTTEHDPTADTATFAGLTMNGDIAMGSNKITGLADGTAASDAVNKGQLDSVAAGFDPKESVRVRTVLDMSTWTPAGSGVGATLTAPTDASSFNTIDGVLLTAGNRVLVITAADAAGSVDTENGIYTVTALGDDGGTSFELTRAVDFDEDAEVTAGAFTFVTEGTTWGDTGWYVVTNDPIVVDTTAFTFSQFSGVGTFTGGDGIDITGSTISVDLATNPGLEFSSGELQVLVDPAGAIERVAAGIGINLEATDPSLQIVSNELGIKFDAAGGLEKDAGGVQINLEATNPTLQINGSNELGAKLDAAGAIITGASGLAVQVDNSTIQINGSNELEVLGAGDANRVKNGYTVATGGVTIGDPVFFSGNDTVDDADAATDTARQAFGVAATTESAAATVQVITEGPAPGTITSLTPTAGDYVYLASGGGLTLTAPSGGGNNVVLMGYAINANDLYVKTQYLGKKGA